MGVRQYDGNLPLPQGFLGARPFNRDKLSMVGREDAARAAHLSLFQLHDMSDDPEAVALGIGVLFAAMCLKANLDPHDLHSMGKKVLTANPDGDHVTENSVQVLQDWLGGRIMGKEVSIG